MRFVRFQGLVLIVSALAGCVTLSKGMEDSELATYKGRTIFEFLGPRLSMFNGSARAITNDLQGGLHKAVGDLQRFCAQDGGKPAVGERSAPYPKAYEATVPNFVRCNSSSPERAWSVFIDYRHLSTEVTRFGPIMRYEVSYRAETRASVDAAHQSQMAIEQRIKEAAQAEAAQRETWNSKFRETVKVGDRVAVRPSPSANSPTWQGLIIEVRGPLVQVQFNNVEPRTQWIEIRRLEDPDYRSGVPRR